MPWTGQSFHKHNLGLSPAQSFHAAHIANAILKRSGDEGMSIATANKLVHRDDGGMVPATTPTVPETTPGLQPNIQNQNPQSQNLMQRFSSMSAEQLRELAPRLSGQMAAIAQRVLRQKQMTPQQGYGQQSQPQTAVPQFGVPSTPPPVTQAYSGGVIGYAKGGAPAGKEDCVPILAAGGEFVISPHHVAILGEGDVSKGHRLLDKWVVDTRRQIVDKMQRLKGPVKS